ncbi:MAG TPA: glycosyltransferase family 39 protein, partial [Thermoleophilaceae bacterium]|nr:glycosyltransferase family 39 protein [Thermoleophilaceae bacterium]
MHRLILALILLGGFALRVWNNDYGLPFVYSVDEASHFASRAVEMFWQDLDPGYYQNPAAYTYLIYGLFRGMYGPLGFLFDLDYANVTEQFEKDPSEMWIAARTLAAALCMAGVLATYAAARRLWGVREGLVAAAVLAFAFLPVAYSRVAVTDVGSLAGVALALLFAVRAGESGRLQWYALAGAAGGLAVAFKYTAGLALLPLAIAAVARLRADRLRAVGGLALGGLVATAVFALLNPFVFGSLGDWWRDLRDQADVAASDPKPGQESGGVSYYLESLTWGLGWAGLATALAGGVLVLRRDLLRGLMLVAVPVALFAYLALQSRYFGRWLLPAYPALAMLAGVGISRLADWIVSKRRPQPAPAGRAPAASGTA